MDRADLQRLALGRIADTRVLLAGKRWGAAYYLAGYAVECALKSCIVARLMRTDQFPEKRFSEQCWTHNLTQLLSLAGLKNQLNADSITDPDLLVNWETVRDWNEASRYAPATKVMAEELYDAITTRRHGVLPWIKTHW